MLIPSNEIFRKLKVTTFWRNDDLLNVVLQLGIHAVRVALLSNKAEVEYNPEYIIPSQIAHLINELGFRAEVLEKVESGVDIIDLSVRKRESLSTRLFINNFVVLD